MKSTKKRLSYFSKGEWAIWLGSLAVILLSYGLGRQGEALSLIASLVGVTALIFCAKGHPFGQILIILFSVLYGVISYTFAYYGEMITYLGMSMPMAVAALISWARNPYQGKHSEVAVGKLKKWEIPLLCLLTVAVTVGFFFILRALETANLLPSTISVATSFCAAYLTFRRSPYYALAYGLNDLVLILLWVLATVKDPGYLSVMVCFVVFFFNDLYGFINWRRMERRQTTSS
ncbi:MAG: nicotinamide mononucleotide transporter [Clostridia bacterium]|nr:nicotinamide mononucleotide transporter [Clostridia bacterium]